jgi:hypothetical protein
MSEFLFQGITITKVFILLAHVFIVFAMLAMVIFLWRKTWEEKHRLEKLIRFFAVVTGFLVYFGLRASGISIPALLLSSISTVDKMSFGLWAALLPAVTGALVGWFCLTALERNSHIAPRGVIVVFAFFLTLFTDVYAATFDLARISHEFDKALIPNLTFIVGLMLYVILRFTPRALRAPAPQAKPVAQSAVEETDEEELVEEEEEDVAPEKAAAPAAAPSVAPAAQPQKKVEPAVVARPPALAAQPQKNTEPPVVASQPPSALQSIEADAVLQSLPKKGVIRIVKHDAPQK